MVPVVKNLPNSAGDIKDTSSIAGSGRSPGGGHGNPLQYSCLENPMDGVILWATVHGVAKSWTQLKRLSTHPHPHTHTHTLSITGNLSTVLEKKNIGLNLPTL